MMHQWVTDGFPTVFEPPIGACRLHRGGQGRGLRWPPPAAAAASDPG